MAGEEAESVGGLSITAGIDDSRVDAELNALLARLQARAEHAQIGIPIGVIPGAAPAGGGGRPAAQPQAPAIRLVGAGGSGGRSKLDLEDLSPEYQRQLTAKMGQAAQAATTASAATVRSRTNAAIAQATSIPTTATEVPVEFDDAKIKALFGAMLRSLQSVADTQAPTITPKIAQRGTRGARAPLTDDRVLRELSYEAQASGSAARTSSTFAPQRTPAEIAAFRQSEARRADEMRRTPSARGPAAVPSVNLGAAAAYQTPEERARPSRGRNELDVERSREERLARAEAQAVSAGRTPRTQASSLGGFLGGRRELIQAEATLAATSEKVRIAQRRVNDPAIIANTRAHRHAVQELTVAEKERAVALKQVESFSGFAAGARNLLAVTAAGAAFSLGLQGIGLALKGIEAIATPLFDQFTGYAETSRQLTGALSDQARQNQNNVNTTVQLAAAQAGLGKSARALVTPLIQERTQTEAGNKAFSDLIDNLKAVNAIRQQNANLPAGVDAQLVKDVTGFAGTGLGGTKSTTESLRDVFNQIGPTQANGLVNGRTPGRVPGGVAGTASVQEAANNLAQLGLTVDTLNSQLRDAGDGAQQFVQGSKEGVQALRDSPLAKAFPEIGQFADSLAKNNVGITGVQSNTDIIKLLQAITRSTTQPAAQLRAQLDIQRPLNIGAVGRELSYALRTQLPVQAGLTGITSPLAKVGTGIAAANPAEQSRITGSQKLAIDLQSKLNTYYDQGKNILETTYRTSIVQNFGEATAQAYDKALAGLKQVSAQIVDIQSKISNESAAYQTAQYNYQLVIAKRTLSDIGGLTNQNFGAGQSYLGVLERQNLALSRQGQMLGFALSQRQINFQTAIAGFEAPGVTPAERQARIAEAKVEAGFAQKQLDIQKQMFGNQVQIVDISNLRQGVDLAKQVGLLLQGRRVTVDTQIAQEQLGLLAKAQGQLVDEVSAYTSSVATLAGQAMTEISQLEAAAGTAMSRASQAQIGALYGYFAAASTLWSAFLLSQAANPTSGNQGSSGISGFKSASGSLFTTQGATNMTVGEAGAETVAVLRNPRQFMGDLGGGGGGTTIIDVHDNALNSQADMDTLVRKIEAMIGRKASQIGLRTGN